MKRFAAVVALVVFTAGSAHAGAAPGSGGVGQNPFNPPTGPVAVPEPATFGLVAGGAIMLAAVGLFRQKKS